MISPIAVDQSPVHEQLQFSWVEASDGTHIQEDDTIEYRGVRWYAASDSLWIGKSTEGDGSIRFFVRENTNGSGLIWQVMHPMSGALTVWHSGEANRFDEAVEAAISVKLISLEHAGLVWFEQMSTMGPGWITEVGGQTVEVRQQRSGGWTWSHSVSESSIEGQPPARTELQRVHSSDCRPFGAFRIRYTRPTLLQVSSHVLSDASCTPHRDMQ